MIKLLIFDLDGTLFETGPAIHETLTRLLEKRGLEELPYDAVRAAMGQGLEQLVHRLDLDTREKLGDFASLREDFHEIYSKIYLEASPPFPGLYEFLRQWPQKLAIASNKLEIYVRGLIEFTELKNYHWSAIVGGDSFAVKKPDPKPLLHALESAQVQAHEAIMIGDGTPDILAAKAAGIRSIAVDFGYHDADELMTLGADARISHYDQLASVISQW